MARETKAQLAERAAYHARENDVLSVALQCAMHEEPEAIARWHESRPVKNGIEVGPHLGRYTAALYRSASPHGGIVLVTYYCPGQRPHTAAHYFEAWHSEVMRLARVMSQHAVMSAANELKIARDRAYESKTA